jgi:hypothetical protein
VKPKRAGIGFTDENYESPSTSSIRLLRAARGGKGLGRFLWLKAFSLAWSRPPNRRDAEFEADSIEDLLVQPGRKMTNEQMERHNVDQLRLALESSEHISGEAGRRIPLRRDLLADFALGVERLGAVKQIP